MTSDLPQHLIGLPTLTILPPWGTAVARWGKSDENRGRPPPESLRGKRLCIHQGQIDLLANGAPSQNKRTRDAWDSFTALFARGLLPGDFNDASRHWQQIVTDAGHLLAIVTVADALQIHPNCAISMWTGRRSDLSPWMIPGQIAWHFTELEPLAEPILLSGLQGVWRLTHERRIAALMMEAAKRNRARTE